MLEQGLGTDDDKNHDDVPTSGREPEPASKILALADCLRGGSLRAIRLRFGRNCDAPEQSLSWSRIRSETVSSLRSAADPDPICLFVGRTHHPGRRSPKTCEGVHSKPPA